MKKIIALLVFLTPVLVKAQPYSVDWFKVAGGGGSSAGTNNGSIFAVSGTIGQPDASAAMSGGNFSVTGGFWSIVSVVQTPAAPVLQITHGSGTVSLNWPVTAGFELQQNPNLSNTNWVNVAGLVGTNGGVATYTITNPAGALFFRLVGSSGQ